MGITFASGDGGTFDSQFMVFIDLRYGGPEGPILCGPPLPACAVFDAGFPLNASDAQWGRIPPPDSLRIEDVNRFLAGAGDPSKDFWAGVDPDGFRTECIPHTGHPGGVPITHCTGATSCLTSPIVDGSGCDGLDNTCNGVVDACAEDVTLPEPTCPGVCIRECDPVTDISPDVCGYATATDDCNPPFPEPVPDITFEDTHDFEPCGETFDVARVWTATDTCGNPGPCFQQIEVVDTTPPVIDCPFDELIFECVPGIDVSPPTVGECVAADVCDPDVVPIFEDVCTPQCGNSFDLDRTWTATDDCDNDETYPQRIVVEDTTDPWIVCPNDTRILWTDDRSPDGTGRPIGGDLCGDVDFEFDDDPEPGVCLSVEIIRTWTATDECGHQTPCPQFIDVRGPSDAIEDLTEFLSGLDIWPGILQALLSQLENATDSVCSGNAIPAGNQLEAFVNLVTAQSGNAILPGDADELIARAQAIIAAIDEGGACPEGCS
jgi:hypothetical protein